MDDRVFGLAEKDNRRGLGKPVLLLTDLHIPLNTRFQIDPMQTPEVRH